MPRRTNAAAPEPEPAGLDPAAAGNESERASLLPQDDHAAWTGFLDVHTLLMRRLDADMMANHGMPLVEYEVLFKLFVAGGRLPMSQLAEVAMLSRSGLTRIVDVLEGRRLVRRVGDQNDGRRLVATLTPAGRSRLQAARRTHSANVRRLFLEPMSQENKVTLGVVWAQILQGLRSGQEGGPG